jgi:hypothetical protein
MNSPRRTPVRYLATFTALVKGVNALLQSVHLAIKLIHLLAQSRSTRPTVPKNSGVPTAVVE